MARASGIARCQSPLEIKLAQAFARLAKFEWREPDHHYWEVGRWPGWFLVLLAQPQYGRYRPDFGICTWVHEDDEAPPFIIVVEVDGHNYHERTREQAEHDKTRDRFMTRTFAKVLRFTGREVWRDGDACANEALEFAIRLQEPHLTEKWKEWMLAAAVRSAKS